MVRVVPQLLVAALHEHDASMLLHAFAESSAVEGVQRHRHAVRVQALIILRTDLTCF